MKWLDKIVSGKMTLYKMFVDKMAVKMTVDKMTRQNDYKQIDCSEITFWSYLHFWLKS